jgi:archaeosine synthase
MLFQIKNNSGFGRSVEIRLNKKRINFPTICIPPSKDDNPFWKIGLTNSQQITINIPPPALTFNSDSYKQENKPDIFCAETLFMFRKITPSIIRQQLQEFKERMTEFLQSHKADETAVVVQPTDSKLLLEEIEKAITDLGIKHVVLTNLTPFLTNHRRLVQFIAHLRTNLPFDTVLYLFSPVPPAMVPLLFYLGIDAITGSYASLAARQLLYLKRNEIIELESLQYSSCFCPACTSVDDLSKLQMRPSESLSFSPFPDDFSLLERHNRFLFLQILRDCQNALEKNDLRSYIDQYIGFDVTTAAGLRLFDKHWSNQLIARTPTWNNQQLLSVTSYSFSRPAISEFQRRIRKRFVIPSNKSVIVLFPCSATKPYSRSRSHQLFAKAINEVNHKKRGTIQELILTSPLGVIPRQLERVYPAAHYDIPVTGVWSEQEKAIAIDQLVAVLSSCKKETTIVAHVSEEYRQLCKEAEKQIPFEFNYTITNDESVTTKKSLEKLTISLSTAVESVTPNTTNTDNEILRALADYQFGSGIGQQMFPNNYRLKGHIPYPIKILEGREQLGVIHSQTGQMTLTTKTAQVLASIPKYHIVFDGKELQGSSLFAIGVVEADSQIRPTDSVVILNNERELLGDGEAIIAGKDMLTKGIGPVAKIKHFVEDD